jgi:ABC-type transporter Mla maintaining outer membrane lipid asymmetry ATPase subunit MlaF
MIQNGVAKKSEPIVPRIEFRHVSLAYDDQVVLDDVGFTVWPAELKLMLGESGGGKSTVIKLTLGLEKPDAGEIFIDGEEIPGSPKRNLTASARKWVWSFRKARCLIR